MTYQDASHGWWCGARTYPTRCQYCRAEVFYFSCNCGSKVFFDKLGWPWPVHDCTEYFEEQRRIRLEKEYVQRIEEQQERRRKLDMPIQAHSPQVEESIEEVGIVREILRKVDVFKKFDVPSDSPLARQLLGKLATGSYVQVTLHSGDLSCEKLTSAYGRK